MAGPNGSTELCRLAGDAICACHFYPAETQNEGLLREGGGVNCSLAGAISIETRFIAMPPKVAVPPTSLVIVTTPSRKSSI